MQARTNETPAETNLGQDSGDHTIIEGVTLKFACVTHVISRRRGHSHLLGEPRGDTCPQGRILDHCVAEAEREASLEKQR